MTEDFTSDAEFSFDDFFDSDFATAKDELPPVGHYLAEVVKVGDMRWFEGEDNSKPPVQIVPFFLNLLEPQEDVDRQELEDVGGFDTIRARLYQFDFWCYTQGSTKRFLVKQLGVPANAESWAAAFAATVGARVIVKIDHEPSKKDPDVIYPRIKSKNVTLAE